MSKGSKRLRKKKFKQNLAKGELRYIVKEGKNVRVASKTGVLLIKNGVIVKDTLQSVLNGMKSEQEKDRFLKEVRIEVKKRQASDFTGNQDLTLRGFNAAHKDVTAGKFERAMANLGWSLDDISEEVSIRLGKEVSANQLVQAYQEGARTALFKFKDANGKDVYFKITPTYNESPIETITASNYESAVRHANSSSTDDAKAKETYKKNVKTLKEANARHTKGIAAMEGDLF